MNDQLMASASKRCITPSEELMKKLFCVMPMTRFEVVDEDIYVRVIVIKYNDDHILFIAFELDQAPFPHQLMEMINHKYKIPEENIFVLGNHSHEVPYTGIRAAESRHNDKRTQPEYLEPTRTYEAFVMKAAMDAVDEAMKTLCPALFGWREGLSDINMRRPDAQESATFPLDRSLFVMRLETTDGRPLAHLIDYSSHNNCVKSDFLLSADLGGCVSHLLEDHFPGSICIWALGAHGDIMSRSDYQNIQYTVSAPDFADPEKTDIDTLKRKRTLALRQFEDSLNVISQISCTVPESLTISSAVEYADVQTFMPYELPDGSICHMGGEAVIDKSIIDNCNPKALKEYRAALEKEPLPYHLRLHTVRFGDLVFTGNGGKLYNSFKHLMNSMLPEGLHGIAMSQDCCDDSTITYVYDEGFMHSEAEKGRIITVRPGEVTESINNTVKRIYEAAGILKHEE